jgi:hypothetical protein
MFFGNHYIIRPHKSPTDGALTRNFIDQLTHHFFSYLIEILTQFSVVCTVLCTLKFV